jgi:diphosphomevalonate decarboxylase
MNAPRSQVSAIAHPNIAFAKYWGKRGQAREGRWQAEPGNYPAVPSLSLTLDAFTTHTTVALDPTLEADRLTLNGEAQEGAPLERVTALLTRVRAASGQSAFARVTSRNDFPTASGLASSSSGFAALALAAVHAMGLDWDLGRVSDLARQSSASAARSLFGGYVELEAPPAGSTLSARPVAGKDHVSWCLLVAVTTAAAKPVSSTDGMMRSAESPYYPAWLDLAPRLYADMRQALLDRDFERVGVLVEQSSLAMHACAAAAGVFYYTGATLEALAAVRALRAKGAAVYATVDAGPHVKVLTKTEHAAEIGACLRALPAVLRVVEAHAGDGASLVGEEAR